MSLIYGLIYFGYIILGVNTFLFFKSYRNQSVAFKLFTYYLLITLLIQLLSTYIKNYSPIKNNLFLSHYYFIGQFIFLSFFFKQLLKRSFYKKIVTFVLFIVLSMLAIYYFIYPSNYSKFNIFEIVIDVLNVIVII